MIVHKPCIYKHPVIGRWVLKRERLVGFTDSYSHSAVVTFDSAREAWAYAFDGIAPESWRR